MNSVFKKSDLKFCSVPVPDINAHKGGTFEFTAAQIDNYKQSQTHPSIVYVKDGWNGHKYWLATTPYPSATEVFENPCIYYGDEDAEGNPPVVFHPISGTASGNYTMTSNPIVKVDNVNAVNSDCDLMLIDNTMWMISRDNTNKHAVYPQKSATGQAWTPRSNIVWDDTIQPNGVELLSPSLLKDGDDIKAYCLKSTSGSSGFDYENNKGICYGLDILKGTTLEGTGDFAFWKKGILRGNRDLQPWHFDVFKDDATGKFYAVMCASNPYNGSNGLRVYLAESTDGVEFYLYGLPLISHYFYYRPSAFVKDDRTFVMYFSTVGHPAQSEITADMLPNGASDVSTDGRYIGLVTKNFDDLLATLKNAKHTNYTDIH